MYAPKLSGYEEVGKMLGSGSESVDTFVQKRSKIAGLPAGRLQPTYDRQASVTISCRFEVKLR